MTSKPSRLALVDTGFLYALFDPKDSYSKRAKELEPLLEDLQIILPWPCLYETLKTSFVKKKWAVQQFDLFVKRLRVKYVDDDEYKYEAYSTTLKYWRIGKRPISLVDMVVRLMLDDVNIKKHCIITFNAPDFIDVCRKRQIEVIS
jgi:predicted nucleic acid-binding protein